MAVDSAGLPHRVIKRRAATQLIGATLGSTLFGGLFFSPMLPEAFRNEAFAGNKPKQSVRSLFYTHNLDILRDPTAYGRAIAAIPSGNKSLLLLGSSDFRSPTTQAPSRFFPKYVSDFDVFTAGRGFTQSLYHALTLSAIASTTPMDNESRLMRMARSVAAMNPAVQVRLVGLQVDDRAGLQPVEPGIVIDRVGTPDPKHDTLASRFQKVGGWFREVYKAYRDEDIAVVSAHAVWALPLAWALSKKAKAPLVYNPHELETRTPTMTGVKKTLAEQVEARFIRKCRLITTVNDEIADWYADRYRIPRPLVVCNFPAEVTRRPARDLRGELALSDDEALVVHTGNLTGGRNIPLMLTEFEKAARHHVLFVGAGELQPLVEEYAARSKFIHHMPPVPPDEVVSVVKGADLALSLIETLAQSYAWSSPNKLFEALAAGTPPLSADLPEARRRLGAIADELILTSPATQLGTFLAKLDRKQTLAWREKLVPLPTWEEGVKELVKAYGSLIPQTGN